MKTLALILMSLALCSCGPLATVHQVADQATFDAIAPEYTYYVENDQKLSQKDREIKLHTVKTWADRLKQFEGVK